MPPTTLNVIHFRLSQAISWRSDHQSGQRAAQENTDKSGDLNGQTTQV
jgi:hypothetical protein